MPAIEKEYIKKITKADEFIYVYIPIEIEDDVERLEIHYDYSPWKFKGSGWRNDVDVIVLDELGNDVGTRGSFIRDIVISPYYSTPGYDTRKINKGTWNVVVLPARMISDEIDFSLKIKTFTKEKRWYKGETHVHTENSDGNLSYEQIIKKAKKYGLDYIFITDHNRTILNMPKSLDYLTVIPGLELTYVHGHSNIWGLQKPYSGTFITNTIDGYLKKKKEAEANGALVSLNHPMCSKCGWNWSLDFDFDVVEIWNGPMRTDNMKTIEWWDNELKKGRHLSAVGGSDFHLNVPIVKLFAMPTNHVISKGRAPEEIMAAIKEGRTSITSHPYSTFIDMWVGENLIGDTVELQKDTKITVSVKGLKKGHILKVIDQDGEIYSYKAKRKQDHLADILVRNKGYIRAQVEFQYKGLSKVFYNIGLKYFMPQDVIKTSPWFVYAICSPIWFE